jgi:hypothetical protein
MVEIYLCARSLVSMLNDDLKIAKNVAFSYDRPVVIIQDVEPKYENNLVSRRKTEVETLTELASPEDNNMSGIVI